MKIKKGMEMLGLIMGWLAIVVQLVLMLKNRVTDIPETIIRFFSFFTILTNILVALYFTSKVFLLNKTPFSVFNKKSAVTGLATFILLVGIVYQVVLRGVWEPTGIQLLVDELLHTIIPLYFLVYWYLYAQPSSTKLKSALYWLAYPALYFIFIIIRGFFSNFYPYPFFNVMEIGYSGMAVNFIIILCLIIVLMMGLVYVEKRNFKH